MKDQETLRSCFCYWCGEEYYFDCGALFGRDPNRPLPWKFCTQKCYDAAMLHLEETLESRLAAWQSKEAVSA